MNSGIVDRSRDVSQPLEALSPDETLKSESDFLRGTIRESLDDPLTGSVVATDAKLMKFHGIYQQDDRDLRDERRRQKLESAYQFMVRVRLPGGVCMPSQWLQLDQLARSYGRNSLRLTTRQTFQFHSILKRDLRSTIQGINTALLDTIAACGDDCRGVMCSVNPYLSTVHGEVYELARKASNQMIPRARAYHEIWLGQERVESSAPEEPFYGPTYLPRKFKIGFVIPPINDIDVFTQDLGFIAIVESGAVVGYNVCVGGGMGRTDNAPETYPRLADVIGFVPKEDVLETAEVTAGIQRDYGDRLDRSHARFKYTIDNKGIDWFVAELERRLGKKLGEARDFEFVTNGDDYGWREGENGRSHFTFFIENGRIRNWDGYALLDGLKEIAKMHKGEFRLTPNQNLIIANIARHSRNELEALLRAYEIDRANNDKALRRNSMACVALPTCGLAMAESERYLPTLVSKLQAILASYGLGHEAITIRMSGCPNGCSRPYVAEIGLTGRAPGKYNLYLGGGFHGQRLNKLYLENVGENDIIGALSPIFASYSKERVSGEHFGDFVIRKGYVAEVRHGREFND